MGLGKEYMGYQEIIIKRNRKIINEASLADYTPTQKGWMSPTGKPHIFDPTDEHSWNHHPDFLKSIKAGPKQNYHHLEKAQKAGYTRFTSQAKLPTGPAHYIHFDPNSEGGAHSAMHTLKYLKPEHNSEITIDPIPGAASSKTGSERTFNSVGHAAHHIRSFMK